MIPLILTPSPSYVLDTVYFIKGDNEYEKKDFSFGVVLSARDEEKTITECIDSILNQTYKPKQIIAVNDGSADKTGKILDSYSREIKVIHHDIPKGKVHSIMECVKELYDTDLTFIADADTVYHEKHLDEIRTPFSDEKVGAVCGTVFSYKNKNENLSEKFIRSGRLNEYLLAKYRKIGQSNRRALYVLPGSCIAVRTGILKETGIPQRTEVEDLDCTWLWQEMGYDTVYWQDAIAYTKEPENMRELLAQGGRWYRGTWQTLFIHGRRPIKSKRKRLVSTTWLQLGEGIPLSAVWLGLPIIALYDPIWALTYLAIDAASFLPPMLYYAKKEKKLVEAVKAIPAYYGIRSLYASALLYGFGKTLRDWAKGKRKWIH